MPLLVSAGTKDATLIGAFMGPIELVYDRDPDGRPRSALRVDVRRGEWGEPAPDFDYSEAERGLMVRFSDLFPTSHAVVLRHAGAYYLIDDDWCAQSGCQCGAGLIHLYRIVDQIGATPDLERAGRTEYAGSVHQPPRLKDPLPPKLKQAAPVRAGRSGSATATRSRT